MKILIMVFICISSLYSVGAIQDKLIFTQSDGTTFYGYLKGTSAFNWIQSDGKIVKYNFKDKNYYIANFNNKGELVLSNIKITNFKNNILKSKSLLKTKISKENKDKLHKLFIKRKMQTHIY